MSDRRRAGVRRVIVGLDFGTHSTKCVIRPHGSESVAVICFAERDQALGYPWFTEPSLVRITDENLYFGRAALNVSGGPLFRSLKMQLLPETLVRADYPEFPRGTSPDILIACFISRVLRLIRRSVETAYGDRTKILLNMAAPMDHFENEALKTRYLQIIHAAWESVFGDEQFTVRNRVGLSEACSYFKHRLQNRVAASEERVYDVLPETVAPIVSLSLDPRMVPGFYLMLDMGAGTSEFSINRVNERGADQKVVCYFDQTQRIGGDDFEAVEQRFRDDRESRIADLVERVAKYVQETCFFGFDKDKGNRWMSQQWRNIHLLLTGGAARRSDVEAAVRSVLPVKPHLPGESSFTASWHEPSLGGTKLDLTPGELSLLAVSHGLSIHRRQWPTVFEPQSVEQRARPEIMDRPVGYWYVDT